jgi:protein SCO1/2
MNVTTSNASLIVGLALFSSAAHGDPGGAKASEPCPCHQVEPRTAGARAAVKRTTARYVVPAVDLVDQRGQAVRLADVLSTSRPVALNFIFTSCRTICPVLSASLASLHRAVGDRVQFVSVSIDPEYDWPEVLAAYARRFRVGPRWTLLTGSADAVASVRRAFDAGSASKDDHRPLTFLRPAGSEEWVRLDGFPPTRELVAALGLQEAHAAR